ncbi:importin-5-like [Capsicum galapagoense]
MDEVPRPDWESFETILSNFMENPEEAGLVFGMMIQVDPDAVVLKISNSLGSVHDTDYSRECKVALLARLLTNQDLGTNWNNLSVSSQSTLKCVLLDRIMLEESKAITTRICDIVSDLAPSLLPDNNWPELLPFLNKCFMNSTSNNCSRLCTFILYAQLVDKTDETVVGCVKDLHSLFLNILNNDDTLDDLDVRITATMAVIRFIQCLSSLNEKAQFQDLLPGMMRTLTDALSNNDLEDAAVAALNLFIELARNEPKFLRRQLVVVVGTMIEIAETKSLEEEIRILAVEFMLTLVEAKEKVPGMMKKVPLFTNTCFAILLNLTLDIKDEYRFHTAEPIWHSGEPSWHCAEKQYEVTWATKSCAFGLTCLKRLSIALGGKTITPIAMEQLPSYLVAPEWEKRHAALLAIAQISEGSSMVMIRYLEQFVNMVLRSFHDPHPQVRWAAVRAIHQLLIDFCPYLQAQYHNQILPALAAAMDDLQNTRVQAFAAASVVIFCRFESPDIIEPYVDGLLKKLVLLLQNDNQMVHEEALIALGSIADLSKEHFHKYYDFVMPHLKALLVNANDKSDEARGRNALQCISSVGMAVGKEKFRDDIKQVMDLLKLFQESQVKDFDTIPHILVAWIKICKVIGKDLVPYMSIIMPPTVEFSQLEPDKTVPSDELDDSIHKVKLRDEIICIRGEILLWGKSVAVSVLGSFAEMLEEDFYPWISQAASILVPLLKFYIHRGTREIACKSMPALLLSAKLAIVKGTAQGGNDYFKQLSDHIILAMGDALSSEPETKVCVTILQELNRCLEICGQVVNEDQIRSITDEIKHIIAESSRRKGELTERVKSEDFDAEEAELLRDERKQEVEVFKNIGYLVAILIKTFKAAFLPFLDELSSYIMPMTGEDKTTEERNTCIYVFDHLVGHCGEAALKYFDTYLPFLLDWSNDENPCVRKNALYGLRICAEKGGSIFKPFVGEALSRINVVVTHFKAREPENVEAYDNAVSTLGKICQFHRESIDSAQIIPVWLNCLPIKDDIYEAKAVLDQLCSMVERSDTELLGPNYLHLPKVISVFAEVLCTGDDVVTEQTANRMIHLLRHFKETLPLATLASARALLLPQQEMELESILSPDQKDTNISARAMKLLCRLVTCGNQTLCWSNE